MTAVRAPDHKELLSAACLENVDRVSGDPATSAFNAAARLHQSRWREARNLPMGTHPIAGGDAARMLNADRLFADLLSSMPI